ncbi:alpha/beta fold hydrolase [Streptomyces sp. NPDC088847]|uniref:alpha/beta fold hydrolase n=1 Tax=Streptomyces sp. NPDC088847 TaxID=3365909 RepID=UPI0037F9E906
MPFLDVDGMGAINVQRAGPRGGSPLVLLHGVGLDLTWWGDQFETFGRTRDVVAWDMPGHGLSQPLGGTPTFDALTTALEAVVLSAQAGPADLVGVSVGGMTAQTFALRRPDLVRSLTLVTTLCDFETPVREALRERAHVAVSEGMGRIAELSNERWFPSGFRARRPDVVDRATASLLRADPGFHAGMWNMISGLDLAERIAAITSPTLIVIGAEDRNAPVAMGEKMAGLIPHSSLRVLPGIGHFPPVEAPGLFNGLLGDFLATVDSTHPTTP